MNVKQIYEDISFALPSLKIKENESLHKYTYTKIGGKADILVFPTNYDEIKHIIIYANENHIPITILGNASNVIITDGGIRGIVINLTELTHVSVVNNKITSQSGASIISVSALALAEELTGLEFACGIPGSVGGAVFMNAGAYGGEVADVLESVLVITKDGEFLTLSKEELELRYRHSIVSEKGYLVLAATFSLSSGEYDVIKAKMDELTYLRESKQPLEFPSCGSVFKRPEGHFAGKLIQDSGMQGVSVGGAEVSTKHAGFIVNKGNATSNDYVFLINLIQSKVKDMFNVELETEVRIIGEK